MRVDFNRQFFGFYKIDFIYKTLPMCLDGVDMTLSKLGTDRRMNEGAILIDPLFS